MYRPRITVRFLPLIAAVAIFACKKNEAPPADTGVAMAPPAAAPAESLKVNGIETGKGVNADKTIKDDAHDFGVRDTIYTSVKTEGAGTGKLTARWTYQGGKVVNEESQDISPTGDAHHEFHIVKATAWPKGDYKVEILLNGASAGTKDFSVK
jgi:hypothetical protein